MKTNMRRCNLNTKCLDFPNRSMTPGWLVFPQKNESLELED
ncbi:hypothetical protein NXW50_05285 [Bacteroides thetaiotaomicron]|nr:hypothetical protein [Bacteroides thetaiotaomicron]MCS2277651.1 hypothetical protein [Bacteroides thetaiotaomicron]